MKELWITAGVAITAAAATIVSAVISARAARSAAKDAKAAADKTAEIAEAARGDLPALRLWERRLDVSLEVLRLARNAAGQLLLHISSTADHFTSETYYEQRLRRDTTLARSNPPDSTPLWDATNAYNHFLLNSALLLPAPVFLVGTDLYNCIVERALECDQMRIPDHEGASTQLSNLLTKLLDASREALVLGPAGEKMNEMMARVRLPAVSEGSRSTPSDKEKTPAPKAAS